jgi:hypothetical protein
MIEGRTSASLEDLLLVCPIIEQSPAVEKEISTVVGGGAAIQEIYY